MLMSGDGFLQRIETKAETRAQSNFNVRGNGKEASPGKHRGKRKGNIAVLCSFFLLDRSIKMNQYQMCYRSDTSQQMGEMVKIPEHYAFTPSMALTITLASLYVLSGISQPMIMALAKNAGIADPSCQLYMVAYYVGPACVALTWCLRVVGHPEHLLFSRQLLLPVLIFLLRF